MRFWQRTLDGQTFDRASLDPRDYLDHEGKPKGIWLDECHEGVPTREYEVVVRWHGEVRWRDARSDSTFPRLRAGDFDPGTEMRER